jgi:hypothetical protein
VPQAPLASTRAKPVMLANFIYYAVQFSQKRWNALHG